MKLRKRKVIRTKRYTHPGSGSWSVPFNRFSFPGFLIWGQRRFRHTHRANNGVQVLAPINFNHWSTP